jgi:hypothetical protein
MKAKKMPIFTLEITHGAFEQNFECRGTLPTLLF